MWFIGVEVEQETRAPPPKKNPGSAPEQEGSVNGVKIRCWENSRQQRQRRDSDCVEKKEHLVKSRALTIRKENLEIPGRIQMERFIPVEIFRKKSDAFRGITFFLFYWNDRNFLYHLFGLLVPGFMSRESEKFTGIF